MKLKSFLLCFLLLSHIGPEVCLLSPSSTLNQLHSRVLDAPLETPVDFEIHHSDSPFNPNFDDDPIDLSESSQDSHFLKSIKDRGLAFFLFLNNQCTLIEEHKSTLQTGLMMQIIYFSFLLLQGSSIEVVKYTLVMSLCLVAGVPRKRMRQIFRVLRMILTPQAYLLGHSSQLLLGLLLEIFPFDISYEKKIVMRGFVFNLFFNLVLISTFLYPPEAEFRMNEDVLSDKLPESLQDSLCPTITTIPRNFTSLPFHKFPSFCLHEMRFHGNFNASCFATSPFFNQPQTKDSLLHSFSVIQESLNKYCLCPHPYLRARFEILNHTPLLNNVTTQFSLAQPHLEKWALDALQSVRVEPLCALYRHTSLLDGHPSFSEETPIFPFSAQYTFDRIHSFNLLFESNYAEPPWKEPVEEDPYLYINYARLLLIYSSNRAIASLIKTNSCLPNLQIHQFFATCDYPLTFILGDYHTVQAGFCPSNLLAGIEGFRFGDIMKTAPQLYTDNFASCLSIYRQLKILSKKEDPQSMSQSIFLFQKFQEFLARFIAELPSRFLYEAFPESLFPHHHEISPTDFFYYQRAVWKIIGHHDFIQEQRILTLISLSLQPNLESFNKKKDPNKLEPLCHTQKNLSNGMRVSRLVQYCS